MSTDIKTNLFSFKTFRSPDKVSADIKDKYFIYHPDIEQSLVYGQNISSVREYGMFLETLEPVTDYHDIKNKDVLIYNFSCSLMQQVKNYSLRDHTLNNIFDLPRPMTDAKYFEIWEELLVQLLTQASPLVQQACLQMIIGQYCLLHNSSLTYDDVTKIVVVIPEIVVKDFLPWKYDGCGGKLYGVYSLGIQDYRRVEQTLIGYVPGEVSHIENVMASEYKEKTSRNFLRTEEETEFLSETAIENLNDTTTTDRNEISSEIAKLIEKDKSFNISASVSVSKDIMMLGNITANTSTGYTSNNSSSQSNTEAKNYAKEKVEQARERIEQKVSERRTYKMIKEFEETSKHGYDNRGGTQHVTGVYRWIDKIYRNQLVNYGKRLLLEVDVPHPSMIYKKSLRWKTEKTAAEQNLLIPPKTLDEFGIKSYREITNLNAAQAAAYYGVAIQPYETEEQYVTVDIPQTDVTNRSYTQFTIHDSIQIPQGFVAEHITGIGEFNYGSTISSTAYIEFDFSGKKATSEYYSNHGSKSVQIDLNMNNMAGSISFVVRYRQTNYYSASVSVKCVTDPSLLADWQEETYATLLAAYQTKWDEYNEAVRLQQAQQNTSSEEEIYSNASMNRLIEERELKRGCIEMLGKPYCHKQGKCFYASNPCDCSDPNSQQNCSCNCNNQECTCYDCDCGTEGVTLPPVINQNQQLENYVKYVKFFETAFQWEIMSYEFYPYYYNPQCKWYEIMQTKYENDLIFEAFLQSGMAKVLVPVRPQFEKAVLLYLDCGIIDTECNLTAETEDERNISLLGEIISQDEEVVEDTWETRIPSTLTIIQAKSTYLEDENGLPCAEGETSEFGSDDTTLQGLNAQTETPEEETGGESRETIL